ncbi:DUF1049 domain-containing protein [Novosphingobium sp. KCTC 2891]|uniref:DUF1049 domain-containing protein n=1 Tax=Novosphingobium sp. KCTC 2891 TaxID=2989730 RepID=UPI0022220AF5|nr:DUF1049 domain-containing protein [Novosphingobium sp. KCTC 2891]MCW1384456.1 DUF1049 domain-containing protein [Novosphingobium sp. KCTC 2891]
MKVLRTIFWVLVVALLAAFTVANWQPVEVRIWEGLVLDTKLPALVLGAFLLGFLPTWLVYRTSRWRMAKRLVALETTLAGRSGASLTSTQLDAAAPPPVTETP